MEKLILTSISESEIRLIIQEELVRVLESFDLQPKDTTPKFLPIKEAAKYVGKTENALRVQISTGKLKSHKRGNRHYFEKDYLDRWISGDVIDGAEIKIANNNSDVNMYLKDGLTLGVLYKNKINTTQKLKDAYESGKLFRIKGLGGKRMENIKKALYDAGYSTLVLKNQW